MGYSNKRDFKGVWIPRNVWFEKDLSMSEKALLIEIDYLDNSRKKYGRPCEAGNPHFAEFLGVSTRQVRTYINRLAEKGYIGTHVVSETKRAAWTTDKYRLLTTKDAENDTLDNPPVEFDLTDEEDREVAEARGKNIAKIKAEISEQIRRL